MAFANDGRLTDAAVALAENDSPTFKSTKIPTLVKEMSAAVEVQNSAGQVMMFRLFQDLAGGGINNFSAADTVTIDGDVYEFAAALGTLTGAVTNIGVVIGGDSGASLDNLAAAINGLAVEPATPFVPGASGLAAVGGLLPAPVNGNLWLKAVRPMAQKYLRIFSADAVGGNIEAASWSGISATATGADTTFGFGVAGAGGDLVLVGGAAAADGGLIMYQLLIDAGHKLAGSAELVFPADRGLDFPNSSKFFFSVSDLNGNTVIRDEQPAASTAHILTLGLLGGIAPNIQPGDTVTVFARV